MSAICIISIGFPYKTFAFARRFLFPWSYSPEVLLRDAEHHGRDLGFLALVLSGCMGGFCARVRDERGSLVGNCCNWRPLHTNFNFFRFSPLESDRKISVTGCFSNHRTINVPHSA
jgi:hypothetical protein